MAPPIIVETEILLMNHDTSGGYFTGTDDIWNANDPTNSRYSIIDQAENYRHVAAG